MSRGKQTQVGELSIRQGEVLRMVVDAFIQHNAPISSLFITENFDIGLSSATIRSIFADLERLGYLFSPHRSSGRVPTEKAYRHYVESLPPANAILDEEQRIIQSEYLKREFRLNDILDVTSRLLAMLTNYAGVVIGPEPEKAVLKHIELVDMGGDELLVILVTRSGEVYSRTIFLDERIPGDAMRAISRRLNEMFKGVDLADMREQLRLAAERAPGEGPYLPRLAGAIAENFAQVKSEEEVYTSGIDKLYAAAAQEEHAPLRIEDLGGIFEPEDLMRGIFRRTIDLDDLGILIHGDQDERLAGLSIISASYKMGEKKIGALGIVGPNRMDYVRVASIVEYIRRLISNMITRISN